MQKKRAGPPVRIGIRKSSPTERGPSAHRGMQFSGAQLPELLHDLQKASETLRLMDSANLKARNAELVALRDRSPEEFARLRTQTVALMTDLRSELRRRGAV